MVQAAALGAAAVEVPALDIAWSRLLRSAPPRSRCPPSALPSATCHYWAMTDEAKAIDLALPGWSAEEILVTGYQVVQAVGMTDGHDIRLGNVRVLIIKGVISYFTAQSWKVEEVDNENFRFSLGPITSVTSPLGVYMLLITPNDGRGGKRIQVAAPLAAAVLGGSVIYRELYTNVLSTISGDTQIKGPTFGPPKNFPVPDLDRGSVQRYKDAYGKFATSPERTRIELSLKWFEEAHHASNEDALLRYWFAIEILAMPDTENVRPANELLARAYGVPIDDIRRKIELGRLQGLRSDIAHQGFRTTIDTRLLNFAAAVYTDLLEAILDLPCRRLALSRKATIGESIAPLIPHPN